MSSAMESGQNEVVGDIWKFSKEEDLELERQLKRLNKPAIKTIHDEHGDIYDCMKTVSNEPEHPEVLEFMKNFGLDGEECPLGTVMIKRVTKRDIIRGKIVSNLGDSANIHYAGVRTKESARKAVYAGAGCRFGVYNPQAINGWSAARMVLQAGLFDRIEVGWRVGSGGDIHCFNDQCRGFVYTSTKLPKSWIFANISQKGGPHYNFQVDIFRDSNTGNWRLRVGPYDRMELGYWPKEIFSPTAGLRGLADSVEYGGETYTPTNFPKPPMGIGSLPTKSFSDSSYIAALTYQNDSMTKFNARNLEVLADLKETYDAIDIPYTNSWYKHVVFYGGPGDKQ